jgi:ABC-type molybdate transport system substrate-binding protein
MNRSRRSPHIFIFAITMFVALPSPSPAQVKVLISGGFSAAYQELLPQFEKSTTGGGRSTAIRFVGTRGTARRRVCGAPAPRE